MPTWLAERTARFHADADPFWALCISDCSSVPEFGERKRTGVCCEKGAPSQSSERQTCKSFGSMTVWPRFEETNRGFSFSILAMCAGMAAWQDP